MKQGFFNGMFGRLENGMCRLTMDGRIAVKTSNGDYKVYNVDKGTLVNCSSFVFDIGEEFFFIIPTNKVEKGDIILIGRPKCVISAEKNKITAIDYESSEIKTIIPERHIFMGSTYFYGKIVSMFGNTNFIKGKKGINRMMQFMMMSSLIKGMNGGTVGGLAGNKAGFMGGDFSSMLPLMIMGGGNFGDMFSGMFNFDLGEDDTDESEEESTDDDGADITTPEITA